MKQANSTKNNSKKLGVLIGGSGLIGGTLTYYFKTKTPDTIEILAPSSKKMSLREPGDIKLYFKQYKPHFIINAAIAAIDSDPQLAYETNYIGSIRLANVALELGIPYIHISSAATMPSGENLTEQNRIELRPDLSNYAKSKLMTEMTLEHLHKSKGLDYTVIRLAVVYGTHDHKIQGFHRLFFSIANKSMPVILTTKEVLHSYSNCQKLPDFIHQMLDHRDEFGGQTYNFVDRNPVNLSQLILTIKSYLELNFPKNIHLPYTLAKITKSLLLGVVRLLNRIGIESRMPAEIMFLENFYKTQTLSSKKLEASSFVDPDPGTTIYTELPTIIQYYITRWEHLNLISPYNKCFFDPKRKTEKFISAPEKLLDEINTGELDIFE
jgi:nucleoside-diphosphate-sugar epimerase